ncbi:flagellar biosynthetic protein FliR [Desulfosporosinus orientis DSM 765]|uniref:Flagellar biosynthetic protein FliR n=1 Tax=Desulfosporosinus orientis (strain ATCC 19365 / DSM 765 / NCIMB 8382 / VKM B-1628 / Singapore I) TaxID=768706 RepID=G7WHY1_DESOD|nr:flagellar biosynthetic protein FliR [Desulfosporosinus orientis]AET70278.1 flagellar biosynthetic protein FliR [Desulfosporosinus orientis DSM 765]
MSLAQLLQWNLSLFLLILTRWAGMIMLAPVFAARGVPSLVRLGLAAGITIVLYPLIAATNPSIPSELLPYVAVVIKETLVGLVIGYIIYTMTAILQGAGQLIDFQMGFTMGAAIDPVYGVQSPMMGNFQIVLATMLLLATNSHHYLIAAMVKSYAYIPLNPSNLPANYLFYAQLIAQVFALSIQLAMPIFGALLVSDVGVGLLTRTVPQLNIFSVIFPVKIVFGFVILFLSLPFWGESVVKLFNTNMSWLLQLYQGWKQ